MNTSLGLGAALLTGLLATPHCVMMCGGLCGVLGRCGIGPGVPARAAFDAVLLHLGRLSTYAALGALLGASGAGIAAWIGATPSAWVPRWLAALVLVYLGWRSLGIGAASRWSIGGAARIGRWLGRLTQRRWPLGHAGRAYLLGLTWGLLPCSMVYAMALLAWLSESVVLGAALMFAFGLGTLPATVGTSWLAGRAPGIGRARPGLRRLGGVVLLAVGLVGTVLLPWGGLHAPVAQVLGLDCAVAF